LVLVRKHDLARARALQSADNNAPLGQECGQDLGASDMICGRSVKPAYSARVLAQELTGRGLEMLRQPIEDPIGNGLFFARQHAIVTEVPDGMKYTQSVPRVNVDLLSHKADETWATDQGHRGEEVIRVVLDA
jgi:hypothetical protein